jgi:hypothetical protein
MEIGSGELVGWELTGVGKSDFAGLVGVNPDAGASALEYGGCEPPL